MRPTVSRLFGPTARYFKEAPKHDAAGHTILQRLKKLRSIPLELYPLGAVVAVAIVAAVYYSARAFQDPTLRLRRQGYKHEIRVLKKKKDGDENEGSHDH